MSRHVIKGQCLTGDKGRGFYHGTVKVDLTDESLPRVVENPRGEIVLARGVAYVVTIVSDGPEGAQERRECCLTAFEAYRHGEHGLYVCGAVECVAVDNEVLHWVPLQCLLDKRASEEFACEIDDGIGWTHITGIGQDLSDLDAVSGCIGDITGCCG